MSALDRTDVRILEQLQRDGRLSHVDLAERVGLSPTPCTRRVRRSVTLRGATISMRSSTRTSTNYTSNTICHRVKRPIATSAIN